MGCAAGKASRDIPVVKGFEAARYMGVWHEIARLPKWFERDLDNVTATHALINGELRITNRGVHARHPALTASNFIVMPDHVHLLLIVNYPLEPAFDILDWFQHFMREGETLIAPTLGCREEEVWEEKFWLLLVNAGKPLAAVRKYIKMNPARKAWKDANPDRFVRHGNIRHPSLDPVLSWTAIGDLTLLASPFMFPVRLTRKLTVEQHQPEIARMVELAKMGMVPVCGFLSPGEKELERQLRLEPDSRWIKTVAHGLPVRFDPTVEDSRYLSEGRQIFPDYDTSCSISPPERHQFR